MFCQRCCNIRCHVRSKLLLIQVGMSCFERSRPQARDSTDINVFRKLNFSLRIPLLERFVNQAQEHIFSSSNSMKYVNPFPRIVEKQSTTDLLKRGHLLSMNRRYRPADTKKSPKWRQRDFRNNQIRKQFLMR